MASSNNMSRNPARPLGSNTMINGNRLKTNNYLNKLNPSECENLKNTSNNVSSLLPSKIENKITNSLHPSTSHITNRNRFKPLTSNQNIVNSNQPSKIDSSDENKRPSKSPRKKRYAKDQSNEFNFSAAKVRRSLEDIDWGEPILDESSRQNDECINKTDESEIEQFKDHRHTDFTNAFELSQDLQFSQWDLTDDEELFNEKKSMVKPIDFYGLPMQVKELLKSERNIENLYEWQDTLMRKLLSHNQNLVYCVPTSGGKTLVAELLILREIMLKKKNALFVFPYVSIVREKIRSLLTFSLEFDFVIEEYANDKGSIPVKKRLEKNCLYIATIEKAHLLITCLLEEKRLHEIGLIVVDELHMLGDGSTRGCTLESLLLLCMIARRQKFFNARIIAMSATLNNFEQISQFLEAIIEENKFRPVELIEFVKLNSEIFKYVTNNENPMAYVRTVECVKKQDCDPDNLASLVQESMPDSPLLIFSPNKANCENVVKMLCRILPARLRNHRFDERKQILKELREASGGSICPVLKVGVPFGIAYHHSGLTTDEREIVEASFLNGTLCCIVATSTLAAGVNLPCQRVIIRAPYVAQNFLSSSQYKQMVGRAGRAGLCAVPGESILMIKDSEVELCKSLFVDVQNECISSMSKNLEDGVSRVLLSLFYLRLVRSFAQIRDLLLNQTLYGIQFGKKDPITFLSMLNHLMMKLTDLGLIEKVVDENAEVKLTKLGKGAVKGLIDVNKCNRLYADLKRLSGMMSVNSIFHLLYICTFVFDSDELPTRRNAAYIHDQFFLLNDDERNDAQLMGITEADVNRHLMFQNSNNEQTMEKFRRFFCTLVLYESYKGNITLTELSQKCNIQRGTMQQFFNRFASNAMSLLRFIEELNELWGLQSVLSKVCSQLSLCSNPEIIPLLQLPHVKTGRARLLYNNGYKSLDDIARAKPDELLKCFDRIPIKFCVEMIKYAKQTFTDRADVLRAETAYCIELGNA